MSEPTPIQGYNIVTLMKRLEAATSRLEDLTMYHQDAFVNAASKAAGSDLSAKGTSAVQQGTSATSGNTSLSTPATAAPLDVSADQPPVIADFEKIISGPLKELHATSTSIDSVLGEQISHLIKAFEIQQVFLKAAVKSKHPSTDDVAFQDQYRLISKQAEAVIGLREANRSSKVVNHLSTVAEGVPALGWIGVDGPSDYIIDFRDSAQFYANRVLKEFKEVDKKHTEWVKTYMKTFAALLDYVKKYHPKGVAWSANGVPLEQALKEVESVSNGASSAPPASSAPGAPASGSGGPPPPPPPPPMPPADVFKTGSDDSASAAPAPAGGMSAVFQALNQGESVTSGLKKVDKSQMTHKNPELRKEAPKVPAKKGPAPPKKPAQLSSTPSTTSVPKKRTPKKEFIDGKWIIENFEDEHDLILELEIDHGVFIDRCNNCTIQLKGKGNAVSINECKKVGVLIENLVAGTSVIKSSGIGIQLTGVVSTISLDQTEDSQIYLSEKSIGADIYTAQTSSINVNVPKQGGPEGEYIELPLPEQIVHKFDISGKVTSSFVQHD